MPIKASEYAQIINETELFDVPWYIQKAGINADRPALLRHYIEHGEQNGISPSSAFDPTFYLDSYPDVRRAGVPALRHYIGWGQFEGRYGTAVALLQDATLIVEKGLAESIEVAERVLVERGGTPGFDGAWYANMYTLDAKVVPIVHFAREGKIDGRASNALDFERMKGIWSKLFSASYYSEQIGRKFDDAEAALDHFLQVGLFEGHDASEDFSSDFYKETYVDLQLSPTDLAEHFFNHGQMEGRSGNFNPTRTLMTGRRPYDKRQPTLMIAVHETSRTGAPLLGWAIGRSLAERYNIIFYLGRGGKLLDEFLDFSCLCAPGESASIAVEKLIKYLSREFRLSAIIANSVETSIVVAAAAQTAIPVVALIHEFAGYTYPKGRLAATVRAADVAIVPASIVAEAAQKEIIEIYGALAQNIVVRPQGRLPSLPFEKSERSDLTFEEIRQLAGNAKIVLGAGAVQIRKGVDIFVQTAAEVLAKDENVFFLWVGFGYDPLRDPAYSIWVKEMVNRAGLTDNVLFVPEQQDIKVVLNAADVFFLSSRLDPFPNVVIDAVAAGKYIVCFEDASGIAEMLRSETGERPVGAVARHCSAGHAAELIHSALSGDNVELAKTNIEIAKRIFCFQDYVSFIERQIDHARIARSALIGFSASIGEGVVDRRFYNNSASRRRELAQVDRDFAIGQKSGLININRRRGFSENLAAQNGQDVLDGGRTHVFHDLSRSPPPGKIRLKLLVHLHLHYGDLAFEISDLLSNTKIDMDLYITCSSQLAATEIAYAFRHFKQGAVEIHKIANRGRDVAPLVGPSLSRFISDGRYDVVYHVHGKKSLATDPHSGANWRNFLFSTFFKHQNLAKTLALFQDEPDLGLVFVEDRHNCGWTDNYSIADRFADRLNPKPTLPSRPFFPLGTMFAFRPDVLRSVWALELGEESFPVEPIPEDGTLMHAFERLLPAICESRGLSWCTISDPKYTW